MRNLEYYLVPGPWRDKYRSYSDHFYMHVIDLEDDQLEWSWERSGVYRSYSTQGMDKWIRESASDYEPSSLRGNNRRR